MNFQYLIEHMEIFLKWKNLIVGTTASFSLLGLYFVDLFHDILKDMLNVIVISCILFIVLTFCKISFQLTEYVSRKIERKNKLEQLLNLSNGEAALIKYLFFRPAQTAWFPADCLEAILLLRKNYIEKIVNYRPSGHFGKEINFYKNSDDCLCTLEKSVAVLIKTHQDEIMSKWKKLNCNKKFNKYQ